MTVEIHKTDGEVTYVTDVTSIICAGKDLHICNKNGVFTTLICLVDKLIVATNNTLCEGYINEPDPDACKYGCYDCIFEGYVNRDGSKPCDTCKDADFYDDEDK